MNIYYFTEPCFPNCSGSGTSDHKDSFEKLEATVLTESKSKTKKLLGKGMRMSERDR